jgi:hypothetical protein
MATQSPEYAAPPDDGGHMGTHTQQEQVVVNGDRDRDTEAIEMLGKTPLHTRHPNSGLIWFWAAIVALSLGLIVLARAYF